MDTQINPIKRSNELAPLSREHHEDLLLAWKIRQGIKYAVDPAIIASYCLFVWEWHLKHHFHKEEESFKNILPTGDDMLVKMLEDHIAIANMMDAIETEAGYTLLENLASMIIAHVRFEERVLFNHIEAVATSSQLAMIYEHVHHHAEMPEWKYPFWNIKS